MDGTKGLIRQEMRRRRRALSADALAAAGEAVARHICALPAFADYPMVLAYAAADNEVPTDVFIEAAFAAGKRIYLPRVVGGAMYFAEHRRGADFHPGAFGIAEPLGAQLEERDVADSLAVVPLLAWDSSGSRVGQGGGHYDRAFDGQTRPRCLVGLGYTFQQCQLIPRDRWDLRLNWVVTERGAVRCWDGGDPPPSRKEGAQHNDIPGDGARNHRSGRRTGLAGGLRPAPTSSRTSSCNSGNRRAGVD
jgi:5-formyltetrahydrofolate cyclo-ligase